MVLLRRNLYNGTLRPILSKLRPGLIINSRYQSTVKSFLSSQEDKVESEELTVNEKNRPNLQKQNKSGKKYKPLNRKLKDITEQIRSSVRTSTNDLNEAIDILEEGLSYLREVQIPELIPEDSLYSIFQPILLDIMGRAKDDTVSMNKSLEDLLDLFTTYSVAHQYHFTAVAAHELSNGDDNRTGYENVLKTWLKFLEYSKSTDNPLISKYYGFMRQEKIIFNKSDLRNLAYYAYVQSCLIQNVEYNLNDALKILQTDQVPEIFQIRRTIASLNLTTSLRADFEIFSKKLDKITLDQLDPNGSIVVRKINRAITSNDVNALNRTYEQIQNSALNSKTPITENTLVRLMNGYYECKLFKNVFRLFQDLIKNGIEKPSSASWDYLLRAMGHPSFLAGMSPEEVESNVSVIERTIDTIISNGIDITPKTLSIIIAAFSNLNRFDKVDEYLQKYSNSGDGSLPIIYATKNNILVGLILNQKIAESESKLKEYMQDGSGYIPSTTTMNTFLNYYAKVKNYKAVDGIVQFMKRNNIPEEIGTYTIIMDLFFKMHREKGLSPNIGELLTEFSTQGSVPFNDYAYSTMIDGLVKDGSNLEAARTLYTYASKKYRSSAQLVTSMLQGELDFGSVERAEVLFAYYIKNIRNDTRVWNMMIKSLLPKHEELAVQYFYNFQKQSDGSLEPNFYTYYFLITHFMKRGNSKQIQAILDELSRKPLREMGFELPRILKSLSKKHQVDENTLRKITETL
ncbi:uncharacterized protein PRCAT00006039001 [Priceomyces carsonii]|uniref:uncharacterized protein n=1 Tax=Priceomyces carsonii TaxID=28549 RepID=UPI002ED83B2C|nr:unnamed protein product [Priceomyces carsonii]